MRLGITRGTLYGGAAGVLALIGWCLWPTDAAVLVLAGCGLWMLVRQ
jgi:hypothetical protein